MGSYKNNGNVSNSETELQPPVEVPLEMLSPETLQALIESYILREGTDYGAHEVALETKLKQVRTQLDKKLIKIAFDPNTESVTLLTAQEWRKLQTNV
ncbi:YheU family protein [Bdellovibrio bacteriovorus]